MEKLKFCRYDAAGWHGFQNCLCQADFSNLDGWLNEQNVQCIVKSPCRTVSRHEKNGEIFYAKLMRAQNDGALAKHELFSLMKWALGPSRAIGILKVSAKMLEADIKCPEPVLAVRKRMPGGHHLNLLVTREIKAPTVESIILNGSEDEADKAADSAGRELARLHANHFVHGDFLPRNSCIDGNELIFLDNDKTSYWHIMPPFFLRRRNLDQFAYSLMLLKGLDECRLKLPQIFLNAYAEKAGCKCSFDGVIEKARARWNNKKQRMSHLT